MKLYGSTPAERHNNLFQRPLEATSAQYRDTTQVDVDQLFLVWNDRACFRRCTLYHSMVDFSDDPLASRIKSRYNILFPGIALPLFLPSQILRTLQPH
jgi:hypothetical protein